MRRVIRRAIPSMFHRRLVLQTAVLLVAVCPLVVRLGQLTIAQGEDRLAKTETRLVRRSWTPTTRGRVLDRNGRVLAMDRPAYSVAVDFGVLSGAWAEEQGRRASRRALGESWSGADEAVRAKLAEPFVAAYEAHASRMLDRVADLTDTERSSLDERIDRIVASTERTREAVEAGRLTRLKRAHLSSGRGLTEEDEERLLDAASTPIAEEHAAHVLVRDLRDEVAFGLRRLSTRRVPIRLPGWLGPAAEDAEYVDLLPGLIVRDDTDRVRPFDEIDVAVDLSTLPGPMKAEGARTFRVRGVGRHTIGTLRTRIHAEDHARRREALRDLGREREWLTPGGVDRGRYVDGDAVGHTGIERALEHELRGLRGLRTVRLDTGREEAFEPARGRDVTVTIDALLQARVRAVLEPELGLTTVQDWHGNEGVPVGETLAGAAVVLDINTGHVLALVSTPSPTDTGRWDAESAEGAYPDYLDPFVNRAVGVPYPPGSIVKPLMLAAATARCFYTMDRGIRCTGHLLEDRTDVYRCWIYKRYGLTHSPTGEPVRGSQSVKVSCNIFYYELGRRLGPLEITDIYGELGVGEGFGLGIGGEWPGKVGPVAGPGDGSDLGVSDSILMAMGQGPVTWTPLHAANAYATLARGGVVIPPRLVDDGSVATGARVASLDASAIGAAIEGLRGSVNDLDGTGCSIGFGTGRERIFNAPGVALWGKTGTAQAPPLRADPDGPGPEPERVVRSGDHAWFNVLAGPEGGEPRYAISVLIEYGGGGGRVAGPVANQIVHALAAEGYLPGGAGREGSIVGPVAGGAGARP